MTSPRRLLTNWQKFRRLARADRLLLLQALIMLPLTSVALRLTGFRRWQVVLSQLGHRQPNNHADPENMRHRSRAIARMVRLATIHGPGRHKCLTEALVLWSLLRARGLEGELRIGVHKSEREFQAHAWVTFAGIPLSGGDCDGWFVSFGHPIGVVKTELS